VEIAGRAVELAREDLRVQEERYQLGNVTILDLQASQLALAEAEVAWVEARQTLATAIGQLEAVLGQTIAEMTGQLSASSSPE
jgi:outer membrane protein